MGGSLCQFETAEIMCIMLKASYIICFIDSQHVNRFWERFLAKRSCEFVASGWILHLCHLIFDRTPLPVSFCHVYIVYCHPLESIFLPMTTFR